MPQIAVAWSKHSNVSSCVLAVLCV